MDGATALYFGGALINCTGMGHECLWNRPLGIMNRNSEDFIQTEPESMRGFAMNNVYNAFYHSAFCYLDWDMMQTYGGTAPINIVLHAFSGECVYFSDHVGKTVPQIAKAYADSKGKLYKCDRAANPTYDRLFVNSRKENVLLKFEGNYLDI